MTVEELFHHQDRFIGCLIVRIVERPTAATRLPGGEPLHPDDLAEWQDFVDATSFALPGALPPHLRIQLGTQGYEHPIFDNRCPALTPDGRCSIHDDRKPAMCSAVPLEPALPDGLQRVVLKRRMEEAGWMGAVCIAKGAPPALGFALMVAGRRVVQQHDREALATRRQQMLDETARWADEVFDLLADELLSHVRQGGLQRDGQLVLSMAPVIEVLERSSAATRARCDHYAARQDRLIGITVERAVQLGDKTHRATTSALRRFQSHYQQALRASAATLPA